MVITSISAVHIDEDTVEIADKVPYPESIIPKNSNELERRVRIGQSAQVDGVIYGKTIELKGGLEIPTKALGIYSLDSTIIGDKSMIGGPIISNGEISIGKQVMVLGDVIGMTKIDIDDNVEISGNVISNGDISIGDNVGINGFIISLNGAIAVGDSVETFDIISMKDIEFGNNVEIHDPVIWCENGRIQIEDEIIVNKNPVSKSDLLLDGRMVNPYQEKTKLIDLESKYLEFEKAMKG